MRGEASKKRGGERSLTPQMFPKSMRVRGGGGTGVPKWGGKGEEE